MHDSEPSGTWRRRCRILIVDRRPETRELLSSALSSDEYDIVPLHQATYISSWLEITDMPPDMLIAVDHGEDVHLRRACIVCMRDYQIPVIVMKAVGAPRAELWAERIGAHCIEKPVDCDALRKAVRRVWRDRIGLAWDEAVISERGARLD